MPEAFSTGVEFGLNIGFMLVLYILPGWGIIAWLWPSKTLPWGEQLGLAASLSLALFPVIALLTYQLGLHPGALVAWVLSGAGLAGWLWLRLRRPLRWRSVRTWFVLQNAPDLIYLILIAILLITRLLPIRAMVAPAWGDSVHHTLIVQLMLDHGGLFQSWAPYAPLATFSYHFGFHAAVANWAWLSGADAAHAVLVGGQIINVLAILALYPLAIRMGGGNRWAGVVTVLIAGLLSQMPAYYVNWGRYTQLAGQAILPALLWTFDVWWTEKPRPTPRLLILLVLLGAGLVLTHYRIAAIAACAGLPWAFRALWEQRRNGREWLQRTLLGAGAAILIGLLVLPWALTIRASRLSYVAGVVAARGIDPQAASRDLVAWGAIDSYYTRLLWIGAIGALLLALIRKPKWAVVLLLWSLFTFALTNPYLLHLPGSGLVNNFTLVIGAYLPIALLLGWAAGDLASWLAAATPGSLLVSVVLMALMVYGVRQQLQIVDPSFQLVSAADEAALAWVDQHVAPDAHFLVNGFLAYADSTVVGSDAGWWLPYYTRRSSTVPPILYLFERLDPGSDRQAIRQLVLDIQASDGEPTQLQHTLCQANITHIYLGDRQGQVGFGAAPLIPPAWLSHNSDFHLLHQQGQAQVWAFARNACPAE